MLFTGIGNPLLPFIIENIFDIIKVRSLPALELNLPHPFILQADLEVDNRDVLEQKPDNRANDVLVQVNPLQVQTSQAGLDAELAQQLDNALALYIKVVREV